MVGLWLDGNVSKSHCSFDRKCMLTAAHCCIRRVGQAGNCQRLMAPRRFYLRDSTYATRGVCPTRCRHQNVTQNINITAAVCRTRKPWRHAMAASRELIGASSTRDTSSFCRLRPIHGLLESNNHVFRPGGATLNWWKTVILGNYRTPSYQTVR